MTHGMVIVGDNLMTGGEVLATCLCGWFSSTVYMKVDGAAVDWREHNMEMLKLSEEAAYPVVTCEGYGPPVPDVPLADMKEGE